MSDSKLPFGDLLNNKIPLDDFGAKGFSLNERCDFSGHKTGKVDPHFNSEIVTDPFPVERDLTKTQFPGFNQYQVNGKKNLDLIEKDLNNLPPAEPIQLDPPSLVNKPLSLNNPVQANHSSINNAAPYQALPDKQDIWPKNDYRQNIDTNGYAQGETTSQGFTPNPYPGQQQPGGMPPLNTNSLGNPINMNNSGPLNNRSSVPGTSFGGYFVPNTDFMK